MKPESGLLKIEPTNLMNTELIAAAANATIHAEKPFPQIVGMLIEAGVEFYHVDYLALRKTFYSGDGSVVTTPIPLEGLPPVAVDFDAEALRANILDSQQNHQSWRNFTLRAMRGGVQGYFAFLCGQRVTYFGRQGEQHTEWFPGAKR
ncbi:MAG: hypothetical protein JNJ83_13215 [Verrucomicrobiaceae bacterium]|nr:hypothetical protein [Verrucomicrobiaceae bacterium]